ncbi:MAG: hypothetical protein U0P81_04160 [Holophagaceae bacterium]
MRLLACLLAASALLRADTLSELRSALRALPARQPVKLTVVQKGWDEEEGTRKAYDETFTATDGAEGAAAAGRVRSARKSRGGTREEGTSWVRPHEDLLQELADAKVLEERPDAWEGRPVRRLRLAVDPDLDEDARKHLKRAVSECTVWVGPDGLPVAWRRDLDLKVRALLLFSMEMRLQVQRRYQRHQDRLVVVSEDVDVRGRAMGHPFAAEGRSTARVEP